MLYKLNKLLPVCHPLFSKFVVNFVSDVVSKNVEMSSTNRIFNRTSPSVFIYIVSSSVLIKTPCGKLVKRFGETGSHCLTPVFIFIFNDISASRGRPVLRVLKRRLREYTISRKFLG